MFAARTPRIFLLEEEKLLSQLYDFLIHEWFRKVALFKFASGDRAWQELSRHKPDLLIMDCSQPGIDVRKMLDKLAEVHATFPILLTAESFTSQVKDFIDRGLKVGLLRKPFGIQEFWDALNELVGPSDIPERHTRLNNLFEFRH
jgi:CheY-like chemotaxis protein